MSNKEKPHKKLNWKCSKCKERYNLEELEELGYVERIGNSIVVECPSCENQELIKRNWFEWGKDMREENRYDKIKRIVEDCLLVNEYIKSIDNVQVEFDDRLTIEIELTTVYQKGVIISYVE